MDVVNVYMAILEPHTKFENGVQRIVKKFNMSNGTTIKNKNNADFSAEEFVDNLLREGGIIPCDETSDSFTNNLKLPPYYDEELFKKGQKFFYKNMFSLFLCKLLGLILVLTLPTLKILIMTKQSSTELTAYKRYMATVFHMMLWYDEELKPGSRSWKSLVTIRSFHNSASKKSQICLISRINQADMALTQFGFMGFALARSKNIGIYNPSDEELKGFVHFWRNIGYVLGIEERFNICRDSVKETKEICNLIIEKVFKQTVRNPPEGFEHMSAVMLNGMWVMNPILDTNVFDILLKMVLDNNSDINTPSFNNLSMKNKLRLNYILFTVWSLQFAALRIFHNGLQILTLWLMKHFPYLAYYKYGISNSHVSVE